MSKANSNREKSVEKPAMFEATEKSLKGSPEPSEDSQNSVDYKCGLLFYPQWLQFLATPPFAVMAFGVAACLQSIMVNGMLYVVFQAIEREFQLSSFQSGLLSFSYNVGSCLFLLPVTFFSTKRHRPRIMAIGCAFMALGSALFSLPHFLSPPYRPLSVGQTDVCQNISAFNASTPTAASNSNDAIFQLWYFFLLSQFITGAASTPYYTSTVAYLDDNMPHYKATYYLGIYYFISLIGPAVGYVIAGRNLKDFTDPSADVKALGITPSSPVWVGLWWKQFIYCGVFDIIAAVPLAAVPKKLPIPEKEQADATERKKELEMDSDLGNFFKELKGLLPNPIFITMTFGMSMETMIGTGMSAIGSKLLTLFHHMDTGEAGKLIGKAALGGGAAGSLLGGFIVRKMELSSFKTAQVCTLSAFISWFCLFGFLARCGSLQYIGVHNGVIDNIVQNSSCGDFCSCEKNVFNPVCTTDSKLFTTACAAGCTEELKDGSGYTNCSCVSHKPAPGVPEAIKSLCKDTTAGCDRLWIMVVAAVICLFAAFFISAPCISVCLRVIKPKHKSFAMGVQWLIIRVIGLLPAAVLFGSMVDKGCSAWQIKPGVSTSACAVHDNDRVSWNVVILLLIIKTVSVFCFVSATVMLSKNPYGGRTLVSVSRSQLIEPEEANKSSNDIDLPDKVQPKSPPSEPLQSTALPSQNTDKPLQHDGRPDKKESKANPK